MLPQLMARLAAGMEGFAVWKRSMSWLGVREIWWSSWASVDGMAIDLYAVRARVKKASGERPEQVPWVRHS